MVGAGAEREGTPCRPSSCREGRARRNAGQGRNPLAPKAGRQSRLEFICSSYFIFRMLTWWSVRGRNDTEVHGSCFFFLACLKYLVLVSAEASPANCKRLPRLTQSLLSFRSQKSHLALKSSNISQKFGFCRYSAKSRGRIYVAREKRVRQTSFLVGLKIPHPA